MSKARITYRFEQQASMPPPEEYETAIAGSAKEKPPAAVIPLYQEDTDLGDTRTYGVWKSPFYTEAERIERLIRLTDTEDPRKREADATMEHDPAYEEETMPAASVAYRRTRQRRNWFGLTSSVMGAVLTGIVLGMFVLSLFRGDINGPTPSDLNADLLPGVDAVLGESGEPSIEAPSAADNRKSEASLLLESAQVDLPAWTLYFVQNGVFSSQEGAQAAVDLLKEQGLAGAVEAGDKWSIYAAAADNRDDALLISHQLQEAGLEIYIKPYELPAVRALPWSEAISGTWQEYVGQSRSFITAMLSATMQHINEATPRAVPESQMQQMRSAHQEWTSAAQTVMNESPEEVRSLLQRMNTAINSAMMAMEQYNKKPSAAYLWQAQSAVMEHVIHQSQLLASGESLI